MPLGHLTVFPLPLLKLPVQISSKMRDVITANTEIAIRVIRNTPLVFHAKFKRYTFFSNVEADLSVFTQYIGLP